MRYIRKEKAELELQGIPTLRGQAKEMDPIKEREKEVPEQQEKSQENVSRWRSAMSNTAKK